MKNKIFLTTLLLFSFTLLQGQASMTYLFEGNLNEEGGGPALTPQIAGSFSPNAGCSGAPQFYAFPANTGLTFDNTAAGNFLGTSYTIELLFELDATSPYKKLIDYKNLTSDNGFYVRNNLRFYPMLLNGAGTLLANTFYHVIIRREADNTITAWADGTLAFSGNDPSGFGTMDGNNKLIFFEDDLITSQNEASAGSLHLIRIYDTPLSDPEISTLFSFATCDVASGLTSIAAVPTLSQWGLIILGLLLLTFSTLAIRSRQLVLTESVFNSKVSYSNLPFDKAAFANVLFAVTLFVILLFAVVVSIFGYEMTMADIPGSLVAVPLLAYLLHLLGGEEET